MEEFLRRSLSAYHNDMLYARRNTVLSKEQIEYFNHEYCAIADSVQDAKRELKKKEEIQKNKRSLGSIHKIALPQLRDSLDGGPWVQQVDYISKALEEQECQDPLMKQKVLTLIRDSLKSSSGQLKALKRTI